MDQLRDESSGLKTEGQLPKKLYRMRYREDHHPKDNPYRDSCHEEVLFSLDLSWLIRFNITL